MTQGNNVVTKEFQGMQLSALGMGTMRLPVFDGDDSKIDEEKTARILMRWNMVSIITIRHGDITMEIQNL